ncbi:THAP domain-containing protein 10 [Holothuria leucospilota]|uniref:THAP domain-containing protein 10 n=1 Tax=Holothuria leucospilota TaxID=206669 RepID=A0A9Q1CFN9_HOLLE|nr:THAP domain-containing protein 10 [Holothuria leucospilota]
MGKFCIAGHCSNSSKDGVSLHRFPKLEPYRTLWTRAVGNTRKDWLRPTNASFLCSAHFTEDSFIEFVGKRFSDFGLSPHKLKRLKPDAVPTLFGVPAPRQASSSNVSTNEVGCEPGPSTSTEQPGPSQPTPCPTSFVWEGSVKRRRIGGAFKKRERSRVSRPSSSISVG